MSEPPLLLCPFCGAAGASLQAQFENQVRRGKWGFIECIDCGAKGPDVRTEYDDIPKWFNRAADEWNRRNGKPRGAP